MKHKPRLDLAAMLIQVLLLIVPTSAFATAEADQEIGVPQPMETRAKGCFGVVLSPDGNGFYSVRDGLLTHYQIDPFKKPLPSPSTRHNSKTFQTRPSAASLSWTTVRN